MPLLRKRSQNEFSYGGDASAKRPELGKEISDKDWNDFVYNNRKILEENIQNYGTMYQAAGNGLKSIKKYSNS